MTRRDAQTDAQPAAARLDAWLWHARVLSTRSACARLVAERGARINGHWTDKPGVRVRLGDVVTFSVGQRVRVLRVVGLGGRRESAARAMRLFDELAPHG